MDGMLTVIDGPFAGVVLVVVLVVGLALRAIEHLQGTRNALAGFGAVALAGILTLAIAARTTLPPTPDVVGDVILHQQLDIPPHDGERTLLVRGEPQAKSMDQGGAAVRYTVVVHEGEQAVVRQTGTFDSHWTQRRAARGVRLPAKVSHDEDRVVLPSHPGSTLQVSLDQLDGELSGPVHLAVVPRPPSPWWVVGIGVVLALVGAGADAVEGGKTNLTALVAFLTVFATSVDLGLTDHDTLTTVIGPAATALFVGLLAALPVRFGVRRLWARFAA